MSVQGRRLCVSSIVRESPNAEGGAKGLFLYSLFSSSSHTHSRSSLNMENHARKHGKAVDPAKEGSARPVELAKVVE